MTASMTWHDYGDICRTRGSLAMEVFACITSPLADGPPSADLLAEHLAYQAKLEAEGKLFLAGPLSDPSGQAMSGSGLIIYRADTIVEARELAAADPMHSSGHRCFSLQAWRLNEGQPFGLPALSTRRKAETA
ncbi:YciI family protein [Pseudotabrizicola sp. L79]|uniref:YciI family protein n=1 Tax=Pseudotabrizicola sp. L79 TaxID=3118402 RepID=UPI002F94AB3B